MNHADPVLITCPTVTFYCAEYRQGLIWKTLLFALLSRVPMDTETIALLSRDSYASRYQLFSSDRAHGGNRGRLQGIKAKG